MTVSIAPIRTDVGILTAISGCSQVYSKGEFIYTWIDRL
ncbi:unnamed protein product [Larinioides sclopetarius]|uniref:Uncharacterized protein n=1 Tax=Larinioides sclopetarius TaxID=280406 RepID=A0AAV2AK82_9ARAC